MPQIYENRPCLHQSFAPEISPQILRRRRNALSDPGDPPTALVEETVVIRRILQHLGLPHGDPRAASRTPAATPREIPDAAGLDDDSSMFYACWPFDKNQR
jgi:hypothetical protein